MQKFTANNFHVFEAFEGGNKNDTTEVYVISLKNGEVNGPFTAPPAYSVHHINAYEKSDSKIVLDFCPSPLENMRDYLLLEKMLNPPEKLNKATRGKQRWPNKEHSKSREHENTYTSNTTG